MRGVMFVFGHDWKLQCHCYDFLHENVGNPALNTRPTILYPFCGFLLFERCFSQKLDLEHLSSKYQVMIEMQ
jgi:hypothetical protein